MPDPVSEKKVLKASSDPPTCLSGEMVPSGEIPEKRKSASGEIKGGRGRDLVVGQNEASELLYRRRTVLEAVELPAGVTDLDSGLSHCACVCGGATG